MASSAAVVPLTLAEADAAASSLVSVQASPAPFSLVASITSTLESIKESPKQQIICLCTISWMLGMVMVVLSGLVLQSSGGRYQGGWYLGLVALVTGLRALYISTRSRIQSIYMLRWLCILSVMMLATSVLCVFYTANEHADVRSLRACASYSSTSSHSCLSPSSSQPPINVTCVGHASYFSQVLQCEENYLRGESIDDEDSYFAYQCGCVTSSDACVDMSKMPLTALALHGLLQPAAFSNDSDLLCAAASCDSSATPPAASLYMRRSNELVVAEANVASLRQQQQQQQQQQRWQRHVSGRDRGRDRGTMAAQLAEAQVLPTDTHDDASLGNVTNDSRNIQLVVAHSV